MPTKTLIIVGGLVLVGFYLVYQARQATADITNAPAIAINAGVNAFNTIYNTLTGNPNATSTAAQFYKPL